MTDEKFGELARKYGKLNHYLINLCARKENREDVIGMLVELVKIFPEFAEFLRESTPKAQIL